MRAKSHVYLDLRAGTVDIPLCLDSAIEETSMYRSRKSAILCGPGFLNDAMYNDFNMHNQKLCFYRVLSVSEASDCVLIFPRYTLHA